MTSTIETDKITKTPLLSSALTSKPWLSFSSPSTLCSTRAATKLSLPHYSYDLNTHTFMRRRRGVIVAGASQQYPRHLLAYSLISILVILCCLPDFIVALKDVSVTIPQAVKRGSNAMLTCNYDMENDTLYSVKWYKGRREFYRYTPKENPAMKVFLTQSGLNVERNLSNQSHVVLLAVPLNISGKFTCEISVEAPSFQTAMVSGEMEVVELPEEQASVTGIQPRYRIGDLVDGNCSIKYSKPAANLTWTLNGMVVSPHHIKTYQIEKYQETNLESVMSTIHFMVTTSHFHDQHMRLKCTASIFDIFKEEIESVIEEDRPRIMASGRSYDAHSYPHDNGEGYEDQNESFLTYLSASKSAASTLARPPFTLEFERFYKLLLQHLPTTLSLWNNIKTRVCFTLTTFIIDIERYYEKITLNDMTTYCVKLLQQQQQQREHQHQHQHPQQQQLIKLITVMAILLGIYQHKRECHIDAMALSSIAVKNELKKREDEQQCQQKILANCKGQEIDELCNCIEAIAKREHSFICCQNMQQQKEQQHVLQDIKRNAVKAAKNLYNDNDDCQHLTANQNAINENTTITATTVKTVEKTFFPAITFIDCQQSYMSKTLQCITTIITTTPKVFLHLPLLRISHIRHPCVNDSLPIYNENATSNVTESNNANYMSEDQILLMTVNIICKRNFNERECTSLEKALNLDTITLYCATSWRLRKLEIPRKTKTLSSLPLPLPRALQFTQYISKSLPFLLSAPLQNVTHSKRISTKGFSRFIKSNNNLMAFTAQLLVHQC